jgi:aryl-alcohol dehydrogenase-like predicted oxidoreductase
VRDLTALAQSELNTSIIQLALAYIAKMPSTGTVILGCSNAKQLEEQMLALDIIEKIDERIVEKVEAIVQNKPEVPKGMRPLKGQE